MEHFITGAQHLITTWGAAGVFLLSVIEEIIVPLPSVVVQAGAGFLLLGGEPVTVASISALIFKIAVPAALGVTIGSLVIYGLVYWGGTAVVRRFGKYFGLTEERLHKAKDEVLRRPSLTAAFVVLRFIPVVPSSFIAGVAGLLRLPFHVYVWTTVLGVFVRAIYLGAGGWLAGKTFEGLMQEGLFAGKAIWAAGAIVIVILIFWYVRNAKNRNIQKDN